MDDRLELFDSEHTNFEVHLTILQKLTLYITNRTFCYNIANHSLENAVFITSTRISLIKKKLEQFLQKTVR